MLFMPSYFLIWLFYLCLLFLVLTHDPVRNCSSSFVVGVDVFALLFLILNAIHSGYASNTITQEGHRFQWLTCAVKFCSLLKVKSLFSALTPASLLLAPRSCTTFTISYTLPSSFFQFSDGRVVFLERCQAGGNERRAFSLWHFHFK